ncbi:MAG: diaminopimelate decarboxylase, partial [Endomicrobia bacterium]|nr:diaminopimelate decarboxylase [Endomicrobiia bacterium]
MKILYVTPKLKYKTNLLYFENVNLETLVQKYGSPLYVYSKKQIIENFLNYRQALAKRKHLICFAMKSNSNYEVLRVINSLGGGCDITTGGELYRALKAKVDPQKIVYAGVGKNYDEILFAIKNNILMFNVESKDEVDILNSLVRGENIKIKVAIRVNPEVQTHTISHISTGEEGTKFGIPINDVKEFAKYIKQYCKNLNLTGLHFHIGSQICSIEPFLTATKKVVKLIPEIKKLGIRLEYFNVGGGLGIKYKDEHPPTPSQLFGKILKYIPKELKIICEPGRYIVGNAGILITKVIYHKKIKTKNFLIVDASMTDLIRPSFYGAYHNIIPLKLPISCKQQTIHSYDIVGPVCETSDFLAKNRQLPDILNGEYLVIETAGAYGFVMSSNYNSRLRAAEVMVDDDKHYLIRKRENYKDLIK